MISHTRENYFISFPSLFGSSEEEGVQSVFDNRSTGEAYRSLFDIINSVAVCLAEFL